VLLHRVQDALASGLDAEGHAPAAGGAHEGKKLAVHEVGAGVAVPLDTQVLLLEGLAYVHHPLAVERERLVEEGRGPEAVALLQIS